MRLASIGAGDFEEGGRPRGIVTRSMAYVVAFNSWANSHMINMRGIYDILPTQSGVRTFQQGYNIGTFHNFLRSSRVNMGRNRKRKRLGLACLSGGQNLLQSLRGS